MRCDTLAMGYSVESAQSGHVEQLSGTQKSAETCRGEGGCEYLGSMGGGVQCGDTGRDSLFITFSWHPIRLRPVWTMEATLGPSVCATGVEMSST